MKHKYFEGQVKFPFKVLYIINVWIRYDQSSKKQHNLLLFKAQSRQL